MTSKNRWMFTTALAGALTATAIARGQPAEPPTTAAQPGPRDPRPIAHVKLPVSAFEQADTSSNRLRELRPTEVLHVSASSGNFTQVDDGHGMVGWVVTAMLAPGSAAANASAATSSAPDASAGQPSDPYPATPAPDDSAKPAAPPAKPRPKDPRIDMPEVINAPTGWLLPAGVIYSRTGLDTGGGFTNDERVGLGDVAEFGVQTLDQVRARTDAASDPQKIQPYFAATFRMGIAEDRLFDYQPGLVLGFRKSFQRSTDGYDSRVAELTLVASEHLGPRASVHVGGSFWDAELTGMGVDTTLHDRSAHPLSDQIRAFGGFEARPFDKSQILVDLSWAPEFCYACGASQQIRLRPELAWGVRYQVADWMYLESGVKVPDIATASLLNAQIFGNLTFTTWALRHWIDDLK